MKNFYKIVSKKYYSNCLIEALKNKLKHPFSTKVYFIKNKNQSFHVMWSDSNFDFDFSDSNGNVKRNFIYEGYVRQFKKGFIQEYIRVLRHIKQ